MVRGEGREGAVGQCNVKGIAGVNHLGQTHKAIQGLGFWAGSKMVEEGWGDGSLGKSTCSASTRSCLSSNRQNPWKKS